MNNGRGLTGGDSRVIEIKRFEGGPLLEFNACMFGENRQNENFGWSLTEMMTFA